MIFLDSNVVIDVARGHEVVRDAYFRTQDAQIGFAVSVLVLEELMVGVHRGAPGRQRERVHRLIAESTIVPFERPDALLAARTRAELGRAGQKPSYADLLIGAHALSRGCPLVTANTRHFQHIPGLQLLDWTQPPSPEQDLPHA